MRAVAELITSDQIATGRAVADHLHRTTAQLSRVRHDLLTLGILTTEGEKLRFSIPGMADYVVTIGREPPEPRPG